MIRCYSSELLEGLKMAVENLASSSLMEREDMESFKLLEKCLHLLEKTEKIDPIQEAGDLLASIGTTGCGCEDSLKFRKAQDWLKKYCPGKAW